MSVLIWNEPAQVGFMTVCRVDYEHGASEAPTPHTNVRQRRKCPRRWTGCRSLSPPFPPDCFPASPRHGLHQRRPGQETAAGAQEGPAQGAAAAGQEQGEPREAPRAARTVHRVPAGARSREQGQPRVSLRLLRVQQVELTWAVREEVTQQSYPLARCRERPKKMRS